MSLKKDNKKGRALTQLEQLRAKFLYASRKLLQGKLDATICEKFEQIREIFESIRETGGNLKLKPFSDGRFNEDTVMFYYYRMHFYNRFEPQTKEMTLRLQLCMKLLQMGWDKESAASMTWFIKNYLEGMRLFFLHFKKLLKRVASNPDYYKLFVTNKLSPALYPLATRLCARNLLNQTVEGSARQRKSYLQLLQMLDRVVYKNGSGDPDGELERSYYELKKMPVANIGEWLSWFIKKKMNSRLVRKPQPVKEG